MFAIILAAAVSAGQPAEPAPADIYPQTPGCPVDVEAMMKLSPYDFDQTGRGWRSLDAITGCHIAAADLIATYRRANWGKIDPNGTAVSYWHEGQTRAMGGETDLAIPLLFAGVNPGFTGAGAAVDKEALPIGEANAEYALATVAFLQGNLEALKNARARLAAIPEPNSYVEMIKKSHASISKAAEWPPNLNIVDELIHCFGKPYSVAYACDAFTAANHPQHN